MSHGKVQDYKVVWLPKALVRLAGIGRAIAWNLGIQVADKWRNRIFDPARQLEDFPRLGAVVRELGDKDIREVGFPPYRVIYRVTRDVCKELKESTMSPFPLRPLWLNLGLQSCKSCQNPTRSTP